MFGRDRFIASGGEEGQRVGNDSVRERVPFPIPRRDKSVPTDNFVVPPKNPTVESLCTPCYNETMRVRSRVLC